MASFHKPARYCQSSDPLGNMEQQSARAIRYQPSALDQKFGERPSQGRPRTGIFPHHMRGYTGWLTHRTGTAWRFKLLYDVCAVLFIPQLHLILKVKGRRHIKAVQPYLAGIYLLMPETSGFCPGLTPQLLHKLLCCQPVLLLSCLSIQKEQAAAGRNLVQTVLLPVIPPYPAVRAYVPVQKYPYRLCIAFPARGLIHGLQAGEDTAVLIVPELPVQFHELLCILTDIPFSCHGPPLLSA